MEKREPNTAEFDRLAFTVLAIFYDSEVCRMLHDPDLGLHLMSDTYIVNDLIEDLRQKQ